MWYQKPFAANEYVGATVTSELTYVQHIKLGNQAEAFDG